MHPLVKVVEGFVDNVIVITQEGGSAESLRYKLDVLERIVEIGRLAVGHLENSVTMRELLSEDFFVDSDTGQLVLGRGQTQVAPLRRGRRAPDARVPQELQVPLLLYLVHNRDRMQPIGRLIQNFVVDIIPFLSPLDVESTKTGVPRIATNTRLAARTLRDWGLIRGSRDVAYKTWELSHFGLIIGTALVLEGGRGELEARGSGMVHGSWLADPIQEMRHALEHPGKLRRVLESMCSPHADVLRSMAVIQRILEEYREVAAPVNGGGVSFSDRYRMAADLVERVEAAIPPSQLADDVVKDLALRDLIGSFLDGRDDGI